MAPFKPEEFNWGRLDVWALVSGYGLLIIEEERRSVHLDWLYEHGYTIDSLDCARGLDIVIADLGKLMNWQERFGITLEEENRNLDGLNDGFRFEVQMEGGHVLELLRPDIILKEDERYVKGLLNIAHRHSILQLAFGKRFFTLLVLPEEQTPLLYSTVIREIRSVYYRR